MSGHSRSRTDDDREFVLITGSAKGIGRALAEHFLARGALVEGCSRSEPDWRLENYRHHLVDVRDERQVRGMCRSIYQRHDRLDVLVNSAGIAHAGLALLVPFGVARDIVDTNFLGSMLVAREAVKIMQRRRYGRIISIGSIAPVLRIEGEAVYAASKSALTTFCQVFAREIASLGITCNVVASTPILTDLIGSIPAEKIDEIVGRLAVKRLGTFDDVINVVDFFADPKSDYVTGQVINLGGV